jgi:hypothetical protein
MSAAVIVNAAALHFLKVDKAHEAGSIVVITCG